MSLQSALQRISQIQQIAGVSTADPAVPAEQIVGPAENLASPTSSTKAGSSSSLNFKSALAGADSQGIPTAAYRAAQPVQNGQLIQSLFQPRKQAAAWIANRFGLSISSSYRDPQHNAQVGGVPGSYHTKGLAFDFTGSGQAMQAAKTWAERHPEIFREILVHNAGSGMHLHLAFRSA